MTSDPTPFIHSLKRGADGFINSLILATLAFGVIALGWSLGASAGWFPHAPAAVVKTAAFAAQVTLAFACICFLIDYTIYAIVRTLTEYLYVLTHGAPQETNISIEAVVRADPERRDAAVSYLKDFMARTDLAKKDV